LAASAPTLRFIWYDAMIDTGRVEWQKALDASNAMFFQYSGIRVSDGMFLNFRWSTGAPSSSATYASQLGRSGFELYAGVDDRVLVTALRKLGQRQAVVRDAGAVDPFTPVRGLPPARRLEAVVGTHRAHIEEPAERVRLAAGLLPVPRLDRGARQEPELGTALGGVRFERVRIPAPPAEGTPPRRRPLRAAPDPEGPCPTLS
jgi:hypothetical protein